MADNVVGTKIVIDSSDAKQSVGSLKSQLKEANLQLIEFRDSFGEASIEAINAAKKVAEIKDAITGAKEQADLFDPGNKFGAITVAAGQLAGAFGAVEGAMALAGVESEDLQQQLVKIQGAMAISQGLSEMADFGKSFEVLKVKATNAFRTIKAELGSTGIGAIILAIAAAVYILIENWDKLGGVSKDVAFKNKALADTLDEVNSKTAETISSVNKVNDAFKAAKSGVITKKEALAIYNDTLGDSLGKTTSLEQAEKNLNSKSQDFIKATMLKTQAMALYSKSAELQAQSLTEGQKDNVKWWEKGISAVNQFFTNGLLTYDQSVATYQAVNTNKNKKEIDNQSKVLKDAGDKLLQQSEDLQKKGKFKLDVKSDNSAELELAKKRLELLKEANKLISEENMGARAIELKALDEKYKEEKKLFKKGTKEFNTIQEAYLLERRAINAKFDDEEKTQAKEKALELFNGYQNEFNIIIDNEKLKYDIRKEAINNEQELLNQAWDEKLITEQEYNEKSKSLTEKRIEFDRAEREAKINSWNEIGGALGTLSGTLEQGTELQKGLALAQVAIDTGIAISNLLSTTSAPTPDNLASGGLSGFAKYAVGIAKITANIAQARNIIKTASPNSSSGSPTESGMSAPVYPNMPFQQTVTTLNQGTINALGNQAIKAYVLESDVTNSQGRVTRILNSSRFK